MLVTCPNCQSVFKLPDNDNKNIKMRCTLCATVFRLGDAIILEEEAPEKKSSEMLISDKNVPEKNSLGVNSSDKKDLGRQGQPHNVSENAHANAQNDEDPVDAPTGAASFQLQSRITPEKKKKASKGSTFLRYFLALVFALMAAGGALWQYTDHLDPLKEIFGFAETINQEVVAEQKEAIEDFTKRVELLEIADVRQFVVPNEENDKFEKLTVIEGKVLNRFKEARSFIELEATLFDAEGTPLVTKKQMAGPHISLFQLQVLGQAELEEALRDQISIMNYNVDVQPQESVPFMFIFYNPPSTAANLNVKIISAQLPEPPVE